MAKKKVEMNDRLSVEDIDVDETVNGAEAEVNFEAHADNVELVTINKILSELNTMGGKVRIERKGPTDTSYQYVMSIPAEQFDTEHIKKVFGGGDYKCRTFKSDGGFYKPFEFSIDYRFKGSMDEQDIKGISSKDGDSKTLALVNQLNAKHDSSRQAADMAERFVTKSDQTMMMFMQMLNKSQETQMAMMSQLFQSFSNRPAGPDFATAFAPILIEMIKSNTGSKSPVLELVGALKAVRELSVDLSPEAPKEPSLWEKIALSVVPSVLPTIAGMMANQKPSMVSVTNQGIHPAPVAASESSRIEQTNPHMADGLNAIIGILFNGAVKGADVGAYCDVLTDLIPDDQYDNIMVSLTKPNWDAILFGTASTHQTFITHRKWFEDLKNLILSSNARTNDSNGVAEAGATDTGGKIQTDGQ